MREIINGKGVRRRLYKDEMDNAWYRVFDWVRPEVRNILVESVGPNSSHVNKDVMKDLIENEVANIADYWKWHRLASSNI